MSYFMNDLLRPWMKVNAVAADAEQLAREYRYFALGAFEPLCFKHEYLADAWASSRRLPDRNRCT